MMPLTFALRMAFRAMLDLRAREDVPRDVINSCELSYVKVFIRDNCPAFSLSNAEISSLFHSYQSARNKKKVKVKVKQLSLYV